MEKTSSIGDIKRCPNCGDSDVVIDKETGKLRCRSCRNVFEPELANKRDDISQLKGKEIGGGAKDIIDEKTMVSMKCSSCGSEVTINTDETLNARCPWCRHVLSVNEKIANGSVPDMILPFVITREEAFERMSKYLNERKFLAKDEFVKQFSRDNLMGVFLPYMVVDMNVHAEMSGEGEHQTRRYTVGVGDYEETRYDADLYEVAREFDLEVDDLTIEASSDKLNQNAAINTNNIINAIMPFDTENAVAWDARYVRGYACERRDVNVDDLDEKVKHQVEDIMRYQMIDTLIFFDRGVRWDKMRLEQKGVKWKTAYMPVWMYAYYDKNKNGNTKLHYIAINGRTGEMQGSSPINSKKVLRIVLSVPVSLIAITMISGFLGFVTQDTKYMTMATGFFNLSLELGLMWFLFSGIALAVFSTKYSNSGARHKYEAETRAAIRNLVASDNKKESLHGLRYSKMKGRNDIQMKGIQLSNGGLSVRRVIVRKKINK